MLYSRVCRGVIKATLVTPCNSECTPWTPARGVGVLAHLWKTCAWGVHEVWITHRTKIYSCAERATLRDRRRCGSVFVLSFA